MLGRALGSASLLGFCALMSAGCGPRAGDFGGATTGFLGKAGPKTPAARADAPASRGARFFQIIPEEAYQVTQGEDLDRVVVSGARMEISPAGELLRSAWESDELGRGEILQGSLAVAPHLGGGFLHWTTQRAFRSTTFTGPLTPVSLGLPMDSGASIRGARNGLSSVLLFTDTAARELAPNAVLASPARDPALADLVADGRGRALKLDVFGRVSVTLDGGASFADATPSVGLAPRALGASPGDIWLETWQGRLELRPDGKLADAEQSPRAGVDYGRPFQLVFRSGRAALRETWPWGFRETPPLYAAIFGGAPLADGTAIGIAHGSVARVDLATGEARSMSTDWLPQGVECLPVGAKDGVLFACSWESYQGYGGYVLHSSGGEPPVVEKAFSDDGYFAADDHGALGFVGSCKAAPRLIDQDSRGRDSGDIAPKPVFCVRRGPGDWVERSVDLDPGVALLGWAPRADGSAAAFVIGLDPDALPEPVSGHGSARVSEQGGVRVVRLYQELGNLRWARPSFRPYSYGRSSPSLFIDKRFRVRDDGRIDAWIGPTEMSEMASRIAVGVTLGTDGRPTVHALPPSPSAMAATGDFGVTITQGGRLFETLDHGRTWRDAGPSPVPPLTSPGTCSRIGCALGPVVRLGWGTSAVASVVSAGLPAEPKEGGAGRPRLSCEPLGSPGSLPGAEAASPEKNRSNTVVIATGYGDSLEIIRESGDEVDPSAGSPLGPRMKMAPVAPPSPAPPSPTSAPTAGPAAASPRKPVASSPLLRTHSLLYRPPFEPDAAVLRLNATNANFGYRRPPAVPLLTERGEVALLLAPDGGELLVTPSEVMTLPPFDPRRYFFGESATVTGQLLGRDRPLILGDMRRRTSLEEHGPLPHRPPLYVALDREQLRRRTIAVGRRDDGAVGILVLDGPGAETAGVAELNRSVTSLLPVARLAPWSTLTPASDAQCKAQKGAFRALIVIDPSRWLDLDARSLPGVELGSQGIALVRWGSDRVCLEGLDLTARDARRRADAGPSTLVAKWAGSGKNAGGAASLRWDQLKQPLRCSLGRAAPRPAGEPR
jgi:hypothetical protein